MDFIWSETVFVLYQLRWMVDGAAAPGDVSCVSGAEVTLVLLLLGLD
jgi:hypothetical protein